MIVTNEMENIYSLIEQKKNLFITGKAGTGKTTLLHSISDQYQKRCVVVAPTGVAAINAGGVTIHSMFTLPIGVQIPNEKFAWKLQQAKSLILKNVDLLIIDEISMVRCDLLDAIDRRLRQVKRRKKIPFGGVQVIMFGDMMQLPPVVTNDEAEVLSEFYDDFYFFNANVFKETSFKLVELTEIFRQRDEAFINLLNEIRCGHLSDESKEKINNMMNNKSLPESAIHLCAIRNVADTFNKNKLGPPTHIFNASLTGDFNPKNAICDLELHLRVGARVMITKNDTETHMFYNGTLGTVENIDDDVITVLTDDNHRVFITPELVEAFKYDVKVELNENTNLPETVIDKTLIGTCTQFPLTLAYAITIHKSQGLTFDYVVLHIREIFQSGQLYTAISRCRKMENVSIDYNITDNMISRNATINNFIEFTKKNNNEYGYIK